MSESRAIYSTTGDKATDGLAELIGSAKIEQLQRTLDLVMKSGYGSVIIVVKKGKVFCIVPAPATDVLF
jgi:hypothetical protein